MSDDNKKPAQHTTGYDENDSQTSKGGNIVRTSGNENRTRGGTEGRMGQVPMTERKSETIKKKHETETLDNLRPSNQAR